MDTIDSLGPDFAYKQVADAVAARIRAGEFTHRLPAERILADEYCVAYQTVRHAVAVLRQRGLVVTRTGRGTFVTPKRKHRKRYDPGSDGQ